MEDDRELDSRGDVAAVDEALTGLKAAVDRAGANKRGRDAEAKARSEDDLRQAVESARAAGMAWGQVGEVLGIARGNAYQRYRKRH